MSKQKSIDVTLNPDGTVQVEAQGYTGNSCEQASKFIEDALGLTGATRKKKGDWYATNTTDKRRLNAGG